MSETSTWRPDLLHRIGDAQEVEIASRRTDGSLRPGIVIWAVEADGALYVRSAHGPENGWFRRLVTSGRGRIAGGGAAADIVPVTPDPAEQAAVDAAYLTKYAHYPSIVRGIVGPSHHAVTLRLDPAE